MSFCGLRTFFRSPARVASKILCLRRRTSSSDSAQSVPFAFLADTVRADGPAHAAELPEPLPRREAATVVREWLRGHHVPGGDGVVAATGQPEILRPEDRRASGGVVRRPSGPQTDAGPDRPDLAACLRRTVHPLQDPGHVRLVERVQEALDLYGVEALGDVGEGASPVRTVRKGRCVGLLRRYGGEWVGRRARIPPDGASGKLASGRHESWETWGMPGRATRCGVGKPPLNCKNAGREPISGSTSMLRTMFRSKIYHLVICAGQRNDGAVRVSKWSASDAEASRVADLVTASAGAPSRFFVCWWYMLCAPLTCIYDIQ